MLKSPSFSPAAFPNPRRPERVFLREGSPESGMVPLRSRLQADRATKHLKQMPLSGYDYPRVGSGIMLNGVGAVFACFSSGFCIFVTAGFVASMPKRSIFCSILCICK